MRRIAQGGAVAALPCDCPACCQYCRENKIRLLRNRNRKKWKHESIIIQALHGVYAYKLPLSGGCGAFGGVKCMIKIKVSYEHQEELKRLLERLGPDVKRWKASRNREGHFLKAYIELKDTREN